MARGFGVAGALDHAIVRQVAAAAETAGYATFWTNDTPGGDGLEALRVAAGATHSIGLGVGVIPIDRKPARSIIDDVRRLKLPEERLTVGIGAGGLFKGSVSAVREAALELKQHIKGLVLIGALGPRMTALGGEVADGVLLNWLTPEYVEKSAEAARKTAADSGCSLSLAAAYVRVAFGQPSLQALQDEAHRYETFPQYARNFARIGVDAFETTIFGESSAELSARLTLFEQKVDEVVVRAIVAEDTVENYLSLLDAAAPAGS